MAGTADADGLMPPPTPGFQGARLREARQIRGLKAVELSELLGLSPQAISSYETEQKSPSPQVADAIAEKLNLPAHFFTRPVTSSSGSPVFFRSMSAATKSARTRAEGRLRWLEEITVYLRRDVEFPAVNLPDFHAPSDPMLLGFDDIEHMAEDARKHWMMHDGPIGNMVYLLENQGVIVARDRLGAVTLDSLSACSDRPYLIIGTDKGTAVRWRYDAAHELGHLLLHRNLDAKALTRTADFKRIEKQAHRFAAAFLLPMAAFAEDFFSASLDALRAIKPKWRVSIAMMIMRAYDGGLISDEHRQRLFVNYSRRHWSRQEPLDDKMEAEEPHLLRSAVEMMISHGGQSGAELVAEMALAPGDIESLCGLRSGYLRTAGMPSVSLRGAGDGAVIYELRRRHERYI